MAVPSFKRVELKSGDSLFLLVDWRSEEVFDVEVTDGQFAWKAVGCGCPVDIHPDGRAAWTKKAQEALAPDSNSDTAPTPFEFEFLTPTAAATRRQSSVAEERELRWYWAREETNVRGVGRVGLVPCDGAATVKRFLSAACDLSKTLTSLSNESKSAQEDFEKEMEALGQEVQEAVRSRHELYSRCAALIRAKNMQLKALQGRRDGGGEEEEEDSYLD